MQIRPRLGEILVAAGIIDEFQLKAALGEQQRWGRRLGVTLIKMGMVEEGHLIRALAKQLDLPVASLVGKRIPDDVIALVPARVAFDQGVIPLFVKDGGANGHLFLGMEDPSNLAVLDDLSFRTGMEVHPVMVGPTELGEAIDRYYQARKGGAPRSDPFQNADTMDPGSLRRVTDDSPHPGTAPVEPSIEQEIRGSAPTRPAPPIELDETVEPAEPPAPAPVAAREEAPAHVECSATRGGPTSEAKPPVASPLSIPANLLEDVARAIDETERTRIVAKAIATLLVEKGVLGLDELQAQIALLKAAAADDDAELEPLDG